MNSMRVGLDVAKNVFEVFVVDHEGGLPSDEGAFVVAGCECGHLYSCIRYRM